MLASSTPLLYTQSLTQAGLNPEQAAVYEVLLKSGTIPARKVARQTPYKRGLVYKVLGELAALGLVVRHDAVGKVSVFEPQHPLKLRELAQKKEQQARDAQTALEGILGHLTSDFNLISVRPGIQFFEGNEGIQKVALDSLTAKTEILSYIDNEAVNKYLPKFNQEYIAARNKLAIKKRMITIDTPYIRGRAKDYNRATTGIRLISGKYPFATVMQIYEGKVSYITLDEKKKIGIIIADPHIAEMHRSLFEYTWATAKPLFSLTTRPPGATALA